MAKIKYIECDGTEHLVDVPNGLSVMEGAIRYTIPGIDGDCGGACACATCHVYVDEAWREATGKPSAMEESMLDFAEEVEPNSRLSCQIRVSDALDGLIVRLPASTDVDVRRRAFAPAKLHRPPTKTTSGPMTEEGL